MGKVKKPVDDAEKKALVQAQDMKLIRALAGNDKKLRDRALKNLKKWIEQRNARIAFTKEDFMRIWKGLYYAMWMADKPLVQEECAENIAKLVHLSSPELSLQFFRNGLAVLVIEWFGIDQWRMNKFLMLVRRILRQAFEVLKKNEWKLELVREFGNILLETILQKDNGTHLGCTMHLTEIYLEELAKVSNGRIEKPLAAEFLKPFIKHISMLDDDRQISHVDKFLFRHLMQQSKEGIEYENQFQAWQERGFPGGTIKTMQKIENGEPSDEEVDDEPDIEAKPLDPRAGQVDVILPLIKFDALSISQLIHKHKFSEGTTTKGRKALNKLEHEFEKLSRGIYPFGFKRIRLPKYDGYSTKLRKSVNRLVKFEKNLLKDTKKNRKRKNGVILSTEAKKPKLDSVDFFQNKLQAFIEKSEGKLQNGSTVTKKPKKSKPEKELKQKVKKQKEPDMSDWAFEDYFKRNSGVWIVHKYDSPQKDMNSSTASNSFDIVSNTSLHSSPVTRKQAVDSLKSESPKNHKSDEISSPKVVKKQDSPKSESPKTRRKSEPLFSQNEWDEPPKDGEVEIFVPSNKFKKKMQAQARKEGKSLSDVLNDSLDKIVKKRHSLDSNLIMNPFAHRGEKRVKIDLKLNKSQEIHEHQAMILSSPAIPYDANKRPAKPLLKPNAVKSPINPFYKRKLKV